MNARKYIVLLLLCACGWFLSCDKLNNYYTQRGETLTFSPTTQVPKLHAAVNNLNEFVSIRIDNGTYIFTDAQGGQATWPMTRIEQQTTYVGLSGFIVGIPVMGELGQADMTPKPVCYELACPYCYESTHQARNLTLKVGGYAACVRCKRNYDLNNQGIDTTGLRLDQYRVSYSGPPGNVLSIR